MKKILALILISAFLLCLIPFSVSAKSDGFEISGVDTTPKPGAITVLTPAYSKDSTGMSSDGKIMEIVVRSDVITSTESVGNTIPDDGYVVVIRGSTMIERVKKEASPKKGDKVMLSGDGKVFYIINDNYDPFYSVKISFDGFNSVRTENTIKIYDTGESSKTNIWGSEVVVNGDGFVSSIGGNDNKIPAGGFVISAVGRGRIAELNNAAQLGMSVSVDRSAKTITFEYGKKSVVNSMQASLAEFEQSVESAKQRYAVIDYTKCHEYSADLESIIIKAEEALNIDSVADALLAKRDFEKLLSDAEISMIEYPAVEARALWMRPTSSETREKVAKRVKEVYDMGFNIICLELLYDSTLIFPINTKEYGFSQNPSLNGFDVLQAYIEECRRYGIELHGWMSVYRVGYETSTYASLSVGATHEDLRCISASGKNYVYNEYGNGWFLNPARPEVSELLLKLYGYIFDNYALDGFQLDYIRYPYAEGEMYGYDDYTLSLFEEKYGKNPRTLSKDDALWQTWCEFRAAFVTDFVRSVRGMMNEKRPDMYLGADVAPDFRAVYTKYLQEAEKWLSEGLIDIAYPMAYGTNVIPLYAGFTVSAAAENAYSYIGVGDSGTDVFRRQINETREAGADGFAFFSYAQYVNGNYADTLAATSLAKRSLSPTYNAAAALRAQCEYILNRTYSIASVSEDALSIETIDILFDNLGSLIQSDNAENNKASIEKAIFDLEKSDCEESAKAALLSDLRFALKIASLSRDEAKEKYRLENPLPGEESSDAVSDNADESNDESNDNSQSASESSDISATQNDNGSKIGIIAAICAAAALGAAAIAAVLIKKKRK